MKNRKSGQKQVVFGFSGGLQEDLERYEGVMRVARGEGWEVLGVHEQFERSLTRLVETGRVDGVIGDFISEAWLGDLPGRVPLVHAGRAGVSAGVSSVLFDPGEVGRLAGEHLRGMGYGEVRVFEVPGQPLPGELYAGVCEGAEVEVERVRVRGWEGLRGWLGVLGEPAGLLCPSDFVARRVIGEAVRLGVEVPEGVGVLGVGDRFWDRVAAERGISSIPLPHEELGVRAAELLAERMAGGAVRQVRVRPGGVIARETTLRARHPQALVVRVEAEFRGELGEAPDLEGMARRAGMSRRAFERAFEVQAGTTPYQYLLEMRLRESQRLLRETDWTLGRIGERVGYADPPQFSAFFKRRTGVSPRAWRLGEGGGDGDGIGA